MVKLLADVETSRLLVTVLAAGAVLIWTLEYLTLARHFRPGGFYDWDVLRRLRPFTRGTGWVARFLDVLLGYPGVLYLLGGRAAAAALLMAVPWVAWARLPGLAVVYATNILLIWIRQKGRRGAEGMMGVVFGALLIAELAGDDPLVREACLWFIALQACLSYCSNGITKLQTESWRKGLAVFTVADDRLYGRPGLARFLHAHPWLTKTLTWGTLAMESLFPLVLVTGHPACWLFLGWGVLFHLANAYISGLNTFFWSYLATYPALFFVVLRIEAFLRT